MKRTLSLLLCVAMLLTTIGPLPIAVASADTVDGNLIVDPGFESGNGDAWSVAAPSAITDNADYVKEGQYALILDHTVLWGCGAKQTGFAVEPNTDYVVSFWNKRISGDGAWNLYIRNGNNNVTLTRGQQWFNQTHTNWVHQVLEFNSGNYEVIDLFFQKEDRPASFAVDEVVFMKKSDMPDPDEPDEPVEPDEPEEPDDQNLILNGDFETGDYTGWDASNDCIKAEAAKDGNYGLHASGSVYAGGSAFVDVEPNTTYIFSVDVKSPAGDNAMMFIKRLDENRTAVAAQENPGIPANATEWTTFTKEIDSGDAVILQLQLCCGWDGTDKYFDNASLVKKVTEPDEPDEAEDKNLILNGDFSDGMNHWFDHGTGQVGTGVTDGMLYVGHDGSGNDYVNLVNSQPVSLVKGANYTLSFKIKGDEADQIMFAVKNSNSTDGMTATGGDLYGGDWRNISTDWQTIEVDFTVPADATRDYMHVLLVPVGTGFYLDDVKIVQNTPDHGYISNGDFETGDTEGWTVPGWCAAGVNVTEEAANGGKYGVLITVAWGTIQHVVAVNPNTNYKVKLDYKGDVVVYFKTADGSMTLQEEWLNNKGVWDTSEIFFQTPADMTELNIEFCAYTDTAMLDNISITEVIPGFSGLVNGDFETGDAIGWEVWQQTAITPGAAHDGTYGAHLQGNGNWGNMLVNTVTVEAGKTYTLSFWVKVLSTGVNLLVKQDSVNGEKITGDYFDKNNYAEWTKVKRTFTTPTNQIYINFLGDGGSSAESVYVDSFSLVEGMPDEPSFDGYITNGDFETGELTGWTVPDWCTSSTKVTAAAAKDGSYGAHLTGDQWDGMYQWIDVKKNTTYKFSFDYMCVDTTGYGSLYDKGSTSNDDLLKDVWFQDEVGKWSSDGGVFNTGDFDRIYFQICKGNGEKYIDNIVMVEVPEPSFDGYITNGDFETGTQDGWEGSYQYNEITADAAKNGSYGAHLQGNGEWGNMLNQTVFVHPEKAYILSFWLKVYSGAVYVSVLENNVNGFLLTDELFSMNDYSEWTRVELIFTAPVNLINISFTGARNTVIESVYVDDISLVEFDCDHIYDNDCDAYCNICRAFRQVGEHVYDNDCDAYCNNCDHIRWVEDHVYDNECDTDCNECGTVREVGDHEYNNDCDTSCNFCGAVREVGDHVYDNDCDTSCNFCGTVREVGDHVYSNDCDDHCNICGAFRQVGDHVYDNVCDAYCNNCGTVREVGGHKYDNLCDVDCNICGTVREVGDHEYDNACDADCNECGAVREVGDHEYDNACDADCNECGAVRQVGDHVYDNACDADCNECGAVRQVGDHVYDNACDDDCNICGIIRRESDHEYDNACDADCNECGAVREVEDHDYDNACDVDCNICGAFRQVEDHLYDNDCDTNCNECGAVREVGDHEYDNACDADCNECGAVRQVGDHVYDNACDDDCNICGIIRREGDHVYDNVCDTDCNECGAVRQVAAHLYDNDCDANCNFCDATRQVNDHRYANACDADCDECGAIRMTDGHVYDNVCDTDCNQCGAIRQVGAHDYDNACDADCSHCGAIRKVNDHVYNNVCDTDCNECDATRQVAAHLYNNACDADCNFCGATRQVNDHRYANACDADCDECGAVRMTDGHVYDNVCDTTCNQCGAIRQVGAHDYANACDADCSHCGAIRKVNDHVYNNVCDTDCNQCGAVRQVAAHLYNNACDVDCNFCGATRQVGDHRYANACDSDCNECGAIRMTDGHVYDNVCDTTCNQCGAIRQVGAHDYANACDADCSHCGAIRKVNDHVYNNVCDTDCNECGAVRQVAEHKYDNDCDTDCHHCGAPRQVGDHEYDNACDADCNECGAPRKVGDHKYDNSADVDCNHCGAVRALNGWVKVVDEWYYYENNVKVVNKWIKDNGKWYFLDTAGRMSTNKWLKDSKGWCYVGNDGAMVVNKWVMDSVGWCYVGSDGYAVTNTWKQDSVGWCYLNASGSMTKNAWVKTDGKWYYLDKNGYMLKSAWISDGGKWYYLDQNGCMVANTTLTIGGTKYTFNSSGVWVS